MGCNYRATTADVLAYDKNGNPFITVNNYGKGKVYFVNAPIESSLLSKHNAFDGNPHLVYKTVFDSHIKNTPVDISDSDLVYTYHPSDDGGYIIILNHSADKKKLN